MYNLSLHVQQVLNFSLLSVSVTETDDLGNTHVLFTCQGSADDRDPHQDRSELEVFLDQASLGLSRLLSGPQDGSSQTRNSQA